MIGDTSSAAWAGKEGWVDDIEVTTTTESATYDLEEGLGSCPVSIDRPAKTFTLTGDCTTNATLTLRDGWTLDGAGHTITVVDPSSGSFTGAVLTNEIVSGGASMYISDVTIHGNLASGCSSSLFGVRFDGARGSFTNSTVSAIRYGAGSGCQSGNSVDITNLGGPTRLPVTVDGVSVTEFQKTGIRANGNVALRLTDSSVASSDLDLITASNSLQISRGARAYVAGNTIAGNDWDGNDLWSATGVLLYGAEDVTFIRNVVNGDDTDLGLYVSQDSTYQAGTTTLTCNLFERDAAPDSTPSALDLWSTGVGADADLLAKVAATGNTVRGFVTPYDNVVNEVGGPCASGPVTDVAVDGGDESVTATWMPPSGPDFAPVTSYEVTLTPGGQTQTVTDPTATFSGLSPAKEYTVSVVPVNAAGSGTPASASGTTAPGAATITTTSSTDTTATVSWTVPGNAYTAFDLSADDGAGGVTTKTVDGDARSWTFQGLDPLTTYTVTVTPRIGGASGTSDSADVSTAGTSTAPGPVTGLTLTGSGTTLTADWTAVVGATDYEATLLPGGQVESGAGTSAAFTITPGKEYTVTVVAHNAGGWGPGRSASIDTELPAIPRALQVVGQAEVGSADLDATDAAEPGHGLHDHGDADQWSGRDHVRGRRWADLPGEGSGPGQAHRLHVPRHRDQRIRFRRGRDQDSVRCEGDAASEAEQGHLWPPRHVLGDGDRPGHRTPRGRPVDRPLPQGRGCPTVRRSWCSGPELGQGHLLVQCQGEEDREVLRGLQRKAPHGRQVADHADRCQVAR